MNIPLKVIKIGNSMGVILPKELLKKLGAEVGDYVAATEVSNGIELTPHRPDFEAQMAVARGVMAERRRALRELTK
jgi:putative addiction module antidote